MQLKEGIEILPVASTNKNEIHGAECDFTKLLSETATRLVSPQNNDTNTL